MAGTWDTFRQNTITVIEGITPTVDPRLTWKVWTRGGQTPDRGRRFEAEDTSPVGGVGVFGAGEQQLARVLRIVTVYPHSNDYHARRAHDEGDLEEALSPASTYPSNLYIRRVMREEISEEVDPETRNITVTFPVLHIYRESVTLA